MKELRAEGPASQADPPTEPGGDGWRISVVPAIMIVLAVAAGAAVLWAMAASAR